MAVFFFFEHYAEVACQSEPFVVCEDQRDGAVLWCGDEARLRWFEGAQVDSGGLRWLVRLEAAEREEERKECRGLDGGSS